MSHCGIAQNIWAVTYVLIPNASNPGYVIEKQIFDQYCFEPNKKEVSHIIKKKKL